jgi:hypothetical protein
MIRFIQSFGVLLWPLLLICGVIVVLTVVNGVRLMSWHRSRHRRVSSSINAILFWGVVSATIGFLGQWIAIYKGMLLMAKHGLSSPRALWIGIAESCQTAILGLGILLVAGLLWFMLHSYHRRLEAAFRSKAGDSLETGRPGPTEARPDWARTVLMLVMISMPVIIVLSLLLEGYLARGSRFIWPVLGIAVVALAIALVKTTTLCFKSSIEPRRQRWGLIPLIFLAITSVGLGVYGLVVELFLAARRIAADVEGMYAYIGRGLVGSSATLIVAMMVAIAISVMWFMLRSMVQRIEQAEYPQPGTV